MTNGARTILVVDDTPTNVRVFEAMLEPRGYHVIGARSGAEALAAVESKPVDLVLLDVNMPELDGFAVCRRLRERAETAMLPIVMVTAAGDGQRSEALDAGADDFLRRPFDQAELLARVASLLRIKAYHDELEGQAAELAAWNETLESRVAEAVDELDRLRAMQRFLPAAIAGVPDGSLAPHRALVAVVCCRLHGFEDLVAGAEPEESLEVLGAFHDVLATVVAERPAAVVSAAGHDVTLLFGDPLPCAQPAHQALAAALAVRDRMAPQLARWRDLGRRLDIAAGLSLGHATVGVVGFEGRYDYAAIGPVVTSAARLCEGAEPGAVLAGPQLHRALGDDVDADDLGTRALSGVGDAVRVWSVRSLRSAPPLAPTPGTVAGAAQVRVSVLGPVEITNGDQPVPVTAPKERALLALLAANRGAVVSVDRLADELWGGDVPGSGAAAVRVYVSRLRKTLAVGGAGDVLATRPTGYALDVEPDAVDACRFDALVDDARKRSADGDHEGARRLLREALALWRGPALVEVASAPITGAEAVRLEEARLAAVEDRIDADLACGEHRAVVAELEALTRAHPLRERLWGQRMVALHRSGRQAEAIRAYHELRRTLADELGLEPSSDLADLERRIVAGDPNVG